MRTGIVLSVVAAATLAASGPGYAQGWGGPYQRGGPQVGLDLSAGQQKQLSDLRDASDRKVLALRNDMFAKSTELRQLWQAKDPDRKAIQEKQGEVDQIRKQMQDARTEFHLAALKVLTPEQREKLQASGGPGFGSGWGRGRGGGMGGMGGWGGPMGGGFGGPMMGGGRGGRGYGRCGMGPGGAF